tara:strand:+ start:121335 stop:122015 length:681 start_codon:yes stop_codon:yes gene_type:complete
MNFLDFSLLDRGGILMWPLLLLSLFGFAFFVERLFFLHKGQIRSGHFLDGIKNLLRKRRLLEALTVCEETPGPVATIVKVALLNYDQPETKMRAEVQATALVEIPILERRVGTIAMIAKIAPLMGLLGTVMALLKAFSLMQASGPYMHVANFSQSVAEALITTATGLAIAIVAYLGHHFLHGRVRALVHDMEWVGNNIIQFVLRELPEEEQSAQSPDLGEEEPQEE